MPRPPASVPALVGRERECAHLAALVSAAAQGVGGIVLVSGEAGVGKTALVEAALAGAPLLTVRAAANPLATPAFGPIAHAAHLLRRELPDAFADAAANYPALARLLSDEGAVEIDRTTLLRTLAAALCAIARQRAFALVLEDMQWADCATLELVAELAGDARRAPLFVVLVHRSDGVPRGHPVRMLRDALRRARILNEICVEPLERPEALLLAERLLDGESSEDARLAIVDRGGGVPLFIEAMAAALRARGDVAATRQCAATLPLPETVRDAIMDGVDALPTAGRHAADCLRGAA